MLSLLVGEKTLVGSLAYHNDHGPVLDLLTSGKLKVDGLFLITRTLLDVGL